MKFIINGIYQCWTWLAWRTRIGLILLIIVFIAFGYFYYQKAAQQAEIEQRIKIWVESEAQKDAQRVRESKASVNRAEVESNRIRNANYSNLSSDELKRRIEEEAKKIK